MRNLSYRCSPTILWLRDAEQTLLVDRGRGLSWSLGGVEAVVWDWLAVGRTYEQLVEMLALTLSLPGTDARCQLDRILQRWLAAGILVAGRGHPEPQPQAPVGLGTAGHDAECDQPEGPA